MTYTEILELIRAGYKKEEIESMMAAEAKTNAKVQTSNPAQEDAPIIKEETPAAAPAPAPDPAPEHEPTETEKLVAALGMKIDSLTRAMQASNVNSLESSGSSAPSADEILAKIINPHYGEV